jgi:7-cyano-7-deazaguanine synthase
MAEHMPQWDAGLYLKFSTERTQPSIDLIQRIALADPHRIVDLGCGPGNSTEALRRRWPGASITGLDSSPEMIEAARQAYPSGAWEVADATRWSAPEPCDLVFANALLQWIPDHQRMCRRLMEQVAPGGALAVQLPAEAHYESPVHREIRNVSREPAWRDRKRCSSGIAAPASGPSSKRWPAMRSGATSSGRCWTATSRHIRAGPAGVCSFRSRGCSLSRTGRRCGAGWHPARRLAIVARTEYHSVRRFPTCPTIRRYTKTGMPKAVCLLSGGLDSSTCLALARREGYACYALSFDYGQRHKIELEAARRVAASIGVERHLVARIGLDAFGGSALTGDIAVPKARSTVEMSHGIPVTYVPARNTIFLSFALAWAEVLESSDVFIGVNALDYSGYPDCRPEYIEAYERMANLATRAGVEGRTRLKIHTPLIRLTKAEIVKLGRELGLDFSLTFSCYDPGPEGRPCGQCDACLLRRKGFQEAGIEDR